MIKKELLFNKFRAKKTCLSFEAITGYWKTFLKSIKVDENMDLKIKTLIGGWLLMALKIYRCQNLSCRFEDWLYEEYKIKRQTSYDFTEIFTSR